MAPPVDAEEGLQINVDTQQGAQIKVPNTDIVFGAKTERMKPSSKRDGNGRSSAIKARSKAAESSERSLTKSPRTSTDSDKGEASKRHKTAGADSGEERP